MPPTKKGIYHNLKESKYAVSNSEIAFFFSSKFYRTKFMDGYKDHRKLFKERMWRIAGKTPLNYAMLADLIFYEEIEKRGFYVQSGYARLDYNDTYKYCLRRMNMSNTLEWEINGE